MAVVIIAIILSLTGSDKEAKIAPTAVPSPSPTVVAATPVATVTATATPEPKPLPTMISDYQVISGIPDTDRPLGLPESKMVDDSYFNDTVFVGDSVSEKLKYYVVSKRKDNPTMLGNAKFLTAPSFSARNALKDVTADSLHPTYQGKKMKLEDVIAKMGAKKVYIMLGLNDVGIHGVDRSAENMMLLLKAIKDKSPDVQIFVQSATPRVSGKKPTTQQLFEYNLKVYEYIQQLTGYDIYYLDVAHIMRDDEGKLIEEYCSDIDSMALHFNNTACQKWVDFLYTHALV